MANGNGKWTDLFKTVLGSQVGGWVMACVAFGLVMHWTIRDRSEMYRDLQKLRHEAMPLITKTEQIVDQAKTVTEDNNRILQEIRSMMNIPMRNQRELEGIRDLLKKEKSPE